MHKRSLYSGLMAALFFLIPQLGFAQAPAMDSVMVKDGKIYVVVAVLVVIFIGILLFLWSMERRLKRLEHAEQKS
jgi:CcmD family protein